MKKFKDNKGMDWTVHFTMLAGERVRAIGYDIFDPMVAGDILPQLYANDLAICKIAAAICEPQLKQQSLSVDEFLERIGPDEMGAVAESVTSEIENFFLKSRPQWGRLMRQMREELNKEMTIRTEKSQGSTNGPTISPESLESTRRVLRHV